jgi:hypothetical protein
MKKSQLLIPLAALSLSACGYSVMDAAEDIKKSGKSELADGSLITAEPSKTDAFSKLEAIGPDKVVFVVGDSFQISATGSVESLKHLRYKIKDGQIIIGRDKSSWFSTDSDKGATITVSAPALSSASLIGSGDFNAEKMAGDTVRLELAGSGNLNVDDITAKLLESSIAGSGDLRAGGKVDRAKYSVAGSGSIDAVKLTAIDAEIEIAGSGDAKLKASGTVKADIAGSGDIDVTGGAKCSSSTAGSGSISCS